MYPMACGTLGPRLGIEPVPLVVQVQGPNHRTAREVPILPFWDRKFPELWNMPGPMDFEYGITDL